MDDESKLKLIKEIGKFIVHVTDDLSSVQAERDSNNLAAVDETPAVTPNELIKFRTHNFNPVLDQYRVRVSQFWPEDVFEQIERDHKGLLFAYANEPAVKSLIDQYDHTTAFNEAWDELPGHFRILRQFCGGLATVFANTSNVESDFSILKWEKDEFRSSLTDLALEGIFQCKQFEELSKFK